MSAVDTTSASPDIDECISNPCQNGGICEDNILSYTCNCTTTEYNGTHCESKIAAEYSTSASPDIDECTSNPCQNGGICEDDLLLYTCNCTATEYSGTHCESFAEQNTSTAYLDIDECLSEPCQNGGVCRDNFLSYTCNCSGTGFKGLMCETSDIDECICDPCQNGGICEDGILSYTCNCTGTGYVGTNCDLTPGVAFSTSADQDVDNCLSDPCQNGGMCKDGVLSYACNCSGTGFEGIDCERGQKLSMPLIKLTFGIKYSI